MTGPFGLDGMAPSLVQIRETLHLDDLMASAVLVDACTAAGFEQVIGPSASAPLLDANGRITAWPPTDSYGGDPQ